MRRHDWTPKQIADLTPYQQLEALSQGNGDGTITFRNEKEYFKWLQSRNNNG